MDKEHIKSKSPEVKYSNWDCFYHRQAINPPDPLTIKDKQKEENFILWRSTFTELNVNVIVFFLPNLCWELRALSLSMIFFITNAIKKMCFFLVEQNS